MIRYMLKATVLALALSLPLYPALYMAVNLEGVQPTSGCLTDTECMELDGYDVWFEDELPSRD